MIMLNCKISYKSKLDQDWNITYKNLYTHPSFIINIILKRIEAFLLHILEYDNEQHTLICISINANTYFHK